MQNGSLQLLGSLRLPGCAHLTRSSSRCRLAPLIRFSPMVWLRSGTSAFSLITAALRHFGTLTFRGCAPAWRFSPFPRLRSSHSALSNATATLSQFGSLGWPGYALVNRSSQKQRLRSTTPVPSMAPAALRGRGSSRVPRLRSQPPVLSVCLGCAHLTRFPPCCRLALLFRPTRETTARSSSPALSHISAALHKLGPLELIGCALV